MTVAATATPCGCALITLGDIGEPTTGRGDKLAGDLEWESIEKAVQTFGGIEGTEGERPNKAATKIQAAWRGYDVHSNYKQRVAALARLDHILLLASLPGANKDKLMEQVSEVGQIPEGRVWRRKD